MTPERKAELRAALEEWRTHWLQRPGEHVLDDTRRNADRARLIPLLTAALPELLDAVEMVEMDRDAARRVMLEERILKHEVEKERDHLRDVLCRVLAVRCPPLAVVQVGMSLDGPLVEQVLPSDLGAEAEAVVKGKP